MKTPSFIKRMRLIEWEAFEVNMDEGSLISACYNMGPIGFQFSYGTTTPTTKFMPGAISCP